MNDVLKKLEKSLDECKKKGNFKIDISLLISYAMDKINQNTTTENSITDLESILRKLLQNNFPTTVKIFCYYMIANFNQEFGPSFFASISQPLTKDAIALDKFDININALRNFMVLNQKELVENIPVIEDLFKSKKYDLDFIVNAFYFSNYPMLLLNIVNKISADDLRQYKDFLAKFYLEFGKLLFFNKLQDGSFLNLVKMISRILSNFKCLPVLSTKERISNSVLIPLAEYLVINLEELISLMISFDNKLLVQSINLPIDLYKIYNYYRDYNNPNKKYENFFHSYMSYLFKESRNITDPDIYSEVTKALCEFKIIEKYINPGCYSTEIIENISKFITFSEYLDKSMWFDNNIKNLSHLVNFIENTEVIDLVILLLNQSQYIKNHNDRIITLFNLFNRLISLSLDYGNFVEKESLIYCLFKHIWFVDLVKTGKLEQEDKNVWRHDIFICLIESLFHAKQNLLREKRVNEYINLIKICQDIIDLCFKIVDWEGEGEAFKMYFLLVEDILIFFNDSFFNFLYKDNPKFLEMKKKSEKILDEICKRFRGNSKWDELMFSNEESKYFSLVIVTKYLGQEKVPDFNNILNSIFRRLKEMTFDSKTGYDVEKLLKCIFIIGIRLSRNIKERIFIAMSQFIEYLKKKKESEEDKQLISDILFLSQKISDYIYNNKNAAPIVLTNKILEEINNDYYLVVNKDIDKNLEFKQTAFSTLFLMNLTTNSFNVMDTSVNDNSSIYLEYFRNYYYFPFLEYNNDYCHMLIDTKIKYVTSEWKLVSGIADPIHIYYRYKINLETREIEFYIKCYNSISIVLNNVYFNVFLNENLLEVNKKTIGDILNCNAYYNGIEKKLELLSPYSYYEFNFKCYSKVFDVNYISIEATFDMNVDQKTQFTIKSEPFYIKLSDFLIPDNYSLYETSKFDMFYNTLQYVFSMKCQANCPPENIIKSLNNKLALIEYNSNNNIFKKEKDIFNQIIKKQFPEYYHSFVVPLEAKQNQEKMNNLNEKIFFKMKLSSYCVYNFWVYFFINGEYDPKINLSLLNIDIRTNDLKGLNIVAKEKDSFIKELLNNMIVIN